MGLEIEDVDSPAIWTGMTLGITVNKRNIEFFRTLNILALDSSSNGEIPFHKETMG